LRAISTERRSTGDPIRMPQNQRRSSTQRSSTRAGRTRRSASGGQRPRSLLSSGLGEPEVGQRSAASAARREARAARPRSAIHALPREQEYAFIRSDLRRLLMTAGVVTLLMLAMLVVLD
jgi:hypothetical protein